MWQMCEKFLKFARHSSKSVYIYIYYILSLVAKANALKAELGLPPEIPAAQAISTACEIMQIVAEPNDSLPSMRCRGPRCSGRLRSRFGSGSGCCSNGTQASLIQ